MTSPWDNLEACERVCCRTPAESYDLGHANGLAKGLAANKRANAMVSDRHVRPGPSPIFRCSLALPSTRAPMRPDTATVLLSDWVAVPWKDGSLNSIIHWNGGISLAVTNGSVVAAAYGAFLARDEWLAYRLGLVPSRPWSASRRPAVCPIDMANIINGATRWAPCDATVASVMTEAAKEAIECWADVDSHGGRRMVKTRAYGDSETLGGTWTVAVAIDGKTTVAIAFGQPGQWQQWFAYRLGIMPRPVPKEDV